MKKNLQTIFSTRLDLVIVALFTCVGAILRLYNLDGTLQFLGDQGRDALIVHDMLIHKDPVFIGPVTSVGNMYLGPGYYYFMLPFYALTYPSPMGPVYAVALIGIVTIPLMYVLGRELIGKTPALIATVMYSVTWTFIELTRFSWNPNPAPLVSLIMIWAVYRAWTRSPKYWIVVAIAFSILIQLHYLTLLAGVAGGACWLINFISPSLKPEKKIRLQTIGANFVGAIAFIFSLIPLALFDLRHNFLNLKAFQELVFGDEEHLRPARKWIDVLMETHGRSLQIFFETTIGEMRLLNTVLLLLVGVLCVYAFFNSAKQHRKGLLVLGIWMVTGVLGTAVYRSTVFTHYVAYLFPVATFLLAVALGVIARVKIGKAIVVGCLIIYGWVNVQQYVFADLGWTINEMEATSDIIQSRLQPGEKYNIVLLASHGDIEGMNYRYFLTVGPHPPAPKEEWGDINTLVVINEDKKISDLNDSAIYEIVVFPNKHPSETIFISNGPDIHFLRR